MIDNLAALRDELRRNARGGNFTALENIHLTLVFLGECDEARASDAKRAMDETPFPPLPVAIDRTGRFKRDGGDIWWAGVRESGPLTNFQRALSGNLAARGFLLEKRGFSPHITLGREVVISPDYKAAAFQPFGMTAASVELMQSERIGGKLLYKPIHSIFVKAPSA